MNVVQNLCNLLCGEIIADEFEITNVQHLDNNYGYSVTIRNRTRNCTEFATITIAQQTQVHEINYNTFSMRFTQLNMRSMMNRQSHN